MLQRGIIMNRREFIKAMGLAAGAAGFIACAESNLRAKGEKRLPNIVIIYADDMGYGDLGCQNPDSKIPTTNLDKLASEGIRFVDGHSSSGICSPSRYALLTGRYHWRDFHHIVGPMGPSKFKPGRLTIAEMLRSKGYRTGAIGKWHLGWDWNAIKTDPTVKMVNSQFKDAPPEAFDWTKRIPDGPTDHGFDYYFGDGTINFPPYAWVENDRVLEAPTEMLNLGKMKTKEGSWEFRGGPMVKGWNPYDVLPTLMKKSVEWIDKQEKDRPFFLYFALPSPHAPIIPNDEFIGKSKAGGYGDFVFQTDYVAGQVLKALKDKGFEDDTIVVFTADNGPEIYAFERVRRYDHRSMGELRGLKRDIWDGGHRVPFVIRWPGTIKPGRVSDELVSQVDLMGTFASIVGFDLPNDSAEDSYDISNLLRDNSGKTGSGRKVHVHNTYKGMYAVRKDNWTLIDYKTGSISKMPEWFIEMNKYDTNMPNGGLYDMSKDAGQRVNMIDKYPEKADEMRALLNEIRQKGYSSPRMD